MTNVKNFRRYFVIFTLVFLFLTEYTSIVFAQQNAPRSWQGALALAFSPDGQNMACSDKDGIVRVFDTVDWTEQVSISAHTGSEATGLVYSSDSSRIFSVGRDTIVNDLSATTGELNQQLLAHEYPIRSIAASSDGKYIVTSGEEKSVMLWDAISGKLIKDFIAHDDFINSVSISGDGNTLATASGDGLIKLWDMTAMVADENPVPVKTLIGHLAEVNTVAFSPDDQFIVSGGSDTQVILWDPETGEQIRLFLAHQGAIRAVAFHPENNTLVTGEDGARLLVWDTSTLRLVAQISGVGIGGVNALLFKADGSLMAADKSGKIFQLNVDTGAVLNVIDTGVLPIPEIPNENLSASILDANTAAGSSVVQINEQNTTESTNFALVEPAPSIPGPGGPILVVTANCPTCGNFNDYYSEILLNEGFNAYSVVDVSTVTSTMLTAYDMVVLTSMPLSDVQMSMFSDWVNSGGNLIAMRPDTQLAEMFGLTAEGTTLSEGYLLVDTSQSPGSGIVNRTMQYHGTADRYTLNGASNLATLFSDANTATTSPALTINNFGAGKAAAFTFDLATSIVNTRQGNPAWEAQERDGITPVRAVDKFFGNLLSDPQPDWVDLDNNVDIPQADEQQRLFANLILQMNLAKKPLPRFWYFPRGEKAVVVMTSVDHGHNGTSGRFDEFVAMSSADCSVDDWECVRATSYIYPETVMTDAQAAVYTAQGFEVGLHIDTNCEDYTPASLEAAYTDQINRFISNFPSVSAPETQRHHCVVWSDWATGANVQWNHGIRLDTSYSFWPPSWAKDRPGFFNGTAMPMRFTNLDGSLVDVYQLTTQITEESGRSSPFAVDTLLDRALGEEGYYGAYTISVHSDVATNLQASRTVRSAQARGVPVVSSAQMLDWLDGRNTSSFTGISWNGNVLDFTVTAGNGANGLQAMIPAHSATDPLSSISNEGNTVEFTIETIKGVQYALFTAATGSYAATYGVRTEPPLTVVSTLPVDNATDIGVETTVEAIFSVPVNATTITNETFLLKDPSGTTVAVTVNYDKVTLTAKLTPTIPLIASTTYTAIVKGGVNGIKALDGSALDTDLTWSFTTIGTTGEPNCPCSGWDESNVPVNPSVNDPGSIELGVKFNSDIDGLITGVRFYQANPGSYIGNLWDSTGQLLATGTVTATVPGWQQMDFVSPVEISADTVYVASYYAVNGNYPGDNYFFADSGVDNGPIHLLQDGISGGNGLYAYGASSTFPDKSFKSTNYWVDVVFEPSAGPNCPCSAWDDSNVPANPSVNDPGPIELGVKFNSDLDGVITGVRFYQANPGSYIGNLWDANGGLIATGTLTATVAGWQQMNFVSPVVIKANTVYVASYYAEKGNYAADHYFFANSSVDNGPIHLLQDGISGGNGLYAYGNSSTFPNKTFKSSNYWVDVVFKQDITPPQVLTQTPVPGAIGIATNTVVTATFDEALDPTTINETTFELRGPNNNLISSSISYDSVTQTMTLRPVNELSSSTAYKTKIAGGASGPRVKDLAGNALLTNVDWSFITINAAPEIAISSPVDGATVTGVVKINATTTDDVGVAGVQFFLDGIPLGIEDTVEPYSFLWDSSTVNNGDYVITAVARDTANSTTISANMMVMVSNIYLPQTRDGLVASYNFEEGSGSIVADDSGNNNVGTISGATRVGNGPFGTALSFDGVDDLVVVPHDISLDLTNGMTLEAWVNPKTIDGWRSVILKEVPDELAYALFANNNESNSAGWARIALTSHTVKGNGPLPLGTWTHLAVTYDGSVLRIYQNGIEVGTQNLLGDIVTSTQPLFIGGNRIWGDFFSGLIDEVRVYNRALTAAEIRSDIENSGPVLNIVTPVNNATDVIPSSQISAVFSESLDPISVNESTFELKDAAGISVTGLVELSSNTATFTPDIELSENTLYTVTLKGGAGNILDLSGDLLAFDYLWSFTTGTASLCTSETEPAGCEEIVTPVILPPSE